MSNEDWYRNTTWSPSNQEAFWSRWKRSRTGFHRAQYLKIQGLALLTSGDLSLVETGRDLLRKVICEFPEETMQVGNAWHGIGSSFESQGQFQDAVEAYKMCIDVFDAYRGNVDTGADIDFALLVAEHGITEHQYTAQRYIKKRFETVDSNPFPLHWFKLHAANAFLEDQSGHLESAKQSAIEALEVAEIKRTSLRYHSDLGLVDLENPRWMRVVHELSRIVSR